MNRKCFLFFLIVIICLSLFDIDFFSRGIYYISILLFICYIFIFGYLSRGFVYNKTLFIYLFLCGLNVLFVSSDPIFSKEARYFVFLLVVFGFSSFVETFQVSIIRLKSFYYFNYIFIFGVLFSFILLMLGVLPLRSSDGAGSGFKGLFIHQNTLGPVASISFLFLLVKNYDKRSFISISMILICFSVLIFSASRASILALLICFCLFIYIKRNYFLFIIRKNKILIFCFIGIAIGLGVGLGSKILESGVFNPILEKNQYATDQDDSFASRAFLWNLRLWEFRQNPIFGVGFGATDTYQYLNGLSNNSNLEDGTVETGSAWLGQLSMLGIVGFIPIFMVLFQLKKMFFLIENNGFIVLIFLNLLFFLIQGIFEGNILAAGSPLIIYFWLILGLALSKFNPY